MNIQLIQGQFNAKDALDIITQMIHVKVKYHENKITTSANEEDVKFRETKIKRLQKDLFEARSYLMQPHGNIILQSNVQLSFSNGKNTQS